MTHEDLQNVMMFAEGIAKLANEEAPNFKHLNGEEALNLFAENLRLTNKEVTKAHFGTIQ
jgi:hypothetical protein